MIDRGDALVCMGIAAGATGVMALTGPVTPVSLIFMALVQCLFSWFGTPPQRTCCLICAAALLVIAVLGPVIALPAVGFIILGAVLCLLGAVLNDQLADR